MLFAEYGFADPESIATLNGMLRNKGMGFVKGWNVVKRASRRVLSHFVKLRFARSRGRSSSRGREVVAAFERFSDARVVETAGGAERLGPF